MVEAAGHRRGAAIRGIGAAPAVDRAVFRGSAGDVVGPVRIGDRGVVVVKVESLTLVDPADLASETGTARQRLAAERGQLLLRAMINERRRDTVVTVDNDFIERFAPRG